MLGPALKEAFAVTGKRTFTTVFLPSAVFCGLLVLVFVWTSAASLSASLRTWEAQPLSMRTLHVAGYLLITGLTAAFLSAQLDHLLRVFEGRWFARPFRVVIAVGRRAHLRRIGGLVADHTPDADEALYRRYPLVTIPPEGPARCDGLMPTAVGNAFRSAESHASGRYGIDLALFWPRLFQVVPAESTKVVGTLRARLDTTMVAAVLAAVFGVAATTVVLARGGAGWAAFLCWSISAIIAFSAARTAAAHAVALAEQVKVIVDVHRPALAVQLGDDLAGQADEVAYWTSVGQFWFRGVPGALPPDRPPHRDLVPETPARFAPRMSTLYVLVTGVVAVVLLALALL